MSKTLVEICSVVVIKDGLVDDVYSFADVKKAEEKFLEVLRGYGDFTVKEEKFYLGDGYYVRGDFAVYLIYSFIKKDELEKKMKDVEKEGGGHRPCVGNDD